MAKKDQEQWLQEHGNSNELQQLLVFALENGFDVLDFNGKLILIFDKDADKLPGNQPPKGQWAYQRRKAGESWKTIEQDIKHAIMNAKMYAVTNGLPWPIKIVSRS